MAVANKWNLLQMEMNVNTFIRNDSNLFDTGFARHYYCTYISTRISTMNKHTLINFAIYIVDHISWISFYFYSKSESTLDFALHFFHILLLSIVHIICRSQNKFY